MSLQKQKNIFNKFRTKLFNTRILLRAPRLEAVIALILIAPVMVLDLQPTGMHTPVSSAKATSKAQINHHASSSAKTNKPTAAPSSPASTAPAPSAPPPAPKPPATAGSSKVEPVVTPSPGSSVSSLTPTAPAQTPGTSQSSQVTTGYTSTNWSGYLATNATFTGVSGSWLATNPSGNGSTITADSTWIGIGGVTSGDLIQVGTQNIIAANGQVSTSAFYEMLPSVSQPIASMTVAPGDSMTASISQIAAGQWTISITDLTNGGSFTITVSYASSLSSAEWIEEDPSFSFRRQIPFDNFHEAIFNGGTAVANGQSVSIAASTAQPVIMVNSAGTAIAVPSTLSGAGAFTVSP